MTESTTEPVSGDGAEALAEQSTGLGRDVMTVAVISIVALMLGVNLFLFFDDGSGQMEGGDAPNFELPVMDSETTKELSEYRGQVVLIDFWATWCPPCVEQVPALDEVAADADWSDRVQILSINVDPPSEDRKDLIRTFLDDVDATLTTLIDDGQVQNMYAATTIPTLVVVDPRGQVVYVSQGVHDADRLRELIGDAE